MPSQRVEAIGRTAFGLLFVAIGAIDLVDHEYSTGVGFLSLGAALLARGAVARARSPAGRARAVQAAVGGLFALAFLALLTSVVRRFLPELPFE
jgi:hypothetical protein